VASALVMGGQVHQVSLVIAAPPSRERPMTSTQGAPATVMEQPLVVMAAAQMEPPVALVVPPVA
jgi:Flp pilus assembly protein TadD